MRRGSSISKFLEAYSILESEVYIPKKYRKGYVSLTKRIGNLGDDAPTKLKLLQYKIELDNLLDEIVEEIYRKVKLD